MDIKYRFKGRILGQKDKPLEGLKVKAYDEKGTFLGSAVSNKQGNFDFECGSEHKPRFIKMSYRNTILSSKEIGVMVGTVVDVADWIVICIPSPKDWHLKGRVLDKMSGEPLQGLTVKAFDSDGQYKDPLDEDITDAAGEFNIWFDDTDFDRDEPERIRYFIPLPDVIFTVRNPQGVVIHETEIDQDVWGIPHDCPPYCYHRGKEYTIEIDYVTAAINKVGPVPIADIKASGLASYGGIDDRPFGGNTTIFGRIWGAKVVKWRLSYGIGFIDSSDPRLGQSGSDPFTTIAEGTNRVWDGSIAKWNTQNIEGIHTVILVVWDENENTFQDTQLVFLHNTPITPPAEISTPASCGILNKADGTSIQIQGTASDDYFMAYNLHWVGCSQTELTNAGISYPPTGNHTPVINGQLGIWNISGLSKGPYMLRLSVSDKTIISDGAHTRTDYTWHTMNIR